MFPYGPNVYLRPPCVCVWVVVVVCCPGSYCLRLGLAQTSRQKRRTVAFSQLMVATSWPSPSTTGMFNCWVTFDLARQERATDSKSLRNMENTLRFNMKSFRFVESTPVVICLLKSCIFTD